ncbi:MAG: aminotransferase class IV [Campylobacterota bacterium]|nr:aminotransferase class IV [Campylobacterota bacterium]
MQFLETIKSLDGKLLHLQYHQRRLNKTLKSTSHALIDFLHPPLEGMYRCRVLYDHQKLSISYHSYTLKLPQSFKLVHADTLDYASKYADRSQLNALKREAYDDIIIVKNALISDTTIANVAFLDGERWITPKVPLLEGTTRMRLLESGFLHVSDIAFDNLDRYQGFAVMNAMTGFQIITNGIISIKK